LFGNAAGDTSIVHVTAAIIAANDAPAIAVIGIGRMKVEVATNVQQSLQVRLGASIVS
jgi:hypothetical protein